MQPQRRPTEINAVQLAIFEFISAHPTSTDSNGNDYVALKFRATTTREEIQFAVSHQDARTMLAVAQIATAFLDYRRYEETLKRAPCN